MKKLLPLFALLLGIATITSPVIASTIDTSTENNFVGKYQLIKAVKESKATISLRAQNCRDILSIFLHEDGSILHLRGEDNNGYGLTLNWIENEQAEGIQTEVTAEYIQQKRLWSAVKVLGVERKINLVTSIKNENDVLIYKYNREIFNSLLKKTELDSQVICIYKKI